MSQSLGIAVMMNNYFHDFATALLVGSAVALWVVVHAYDERPDRVTQQSVPGVAATGRYLLAVYGRLTRLAWFSFVWILVGGVPRVIFYKDFEWANAVGHAQVPALIVKHILAFVFVGVGYAMWVRLRRRVDAIRAALAATV